VLRAVFRAPLIHSLRIIEFWQRKLFLQEQFGVLGKKYLELVPLPIVMMAFRSWNVSNNALYLKSIQENKLPNEINSF
jgi:hypothetical protein